MNLAIRTIALALAVLAATTCAAARTIGISLLTREQQFYRDLEKGLRNEAEKNGYKLVITSGDFDPAKQASQIEDFISRKVDAIILSPCDSKAAGSSIAEANRANIPVFTVDIASISDMGTVVSHIASDNIEGGRSAARLILKALNGKGKVVIINHPGVTSVLDRVAGFREVMNTAGGIQIIADVPAWGQRDRAMTAMEDMLLKVPDVSAVFGINDDSALGALAAIESAGRKVIVVGYDATPEARRAIDSKAMYADVLQYPEKIGIFAVQKVSDHFAGKKVPATVPVPVGSYGPAK